MPGAFRGPGPLPPRVGAFGVDDDAWDLTTRPAMMPFLAEYTNKASGEKAGGFAWPQMALDAKAAIEAPGEILFGKGLTPEQQRKTATDAAGFMMGASLAVPKPANSLGMFGGRLSKTADQGALAKAEELAQSGAPREQIWNDTGWFQGVDKKWRNEIDDSGSSFRESPDSAFGHRLRHPGMYRAYRDVEGLSDIGDIKLFRDGRPGDGSYGGDPKLGYENIKIGHNTDDPRSVALHEYQHAIQSREGFARGGSPFNFVADVKAADEMISSVNQNLRDIVRQRDGASPELAAELKKRYDDLMAYKLNDLVPRAQVDPYEAYRRYAGEVEARAVQARMDLTPEQRRARAPWLDYDIPEADHILRFGK